MAISLFVIHIYVKLPNYLILSQQLTKLCYLNRDNPTLYNVRILRLRYWLPCYVGSKFVIPNACSARMRKTSTSTHLSATRTSACGQEERRSMSGQVACWSRGKSLRNTLWCLLGSALGVKVGSTSSTRRRKLTLSITFVDCFRSSLRTATSWCQSGSFSSRTALQRTRYVMLICYAMRRSGCTQTVLRSLRRISGH